MKQNENWKYPYEKLAEKVASHILELEKCPYEISVNLVITDNEEIRKVNAEFRLIDCADRCALFSDDPV